MRSKKAILILLKILILLSSSCICAHAHGVSGSVESGGVVVSARYDTGEPISYADVRVYAPGAETIFQSGRTDRNGRFCFYPDIRGDWKMVVDDAIGHRLEVQASIDEAMTLRADRMTGERDSASKWEKALAGISIIFGFSGILFWWKARALYSKTDVEQ